MKRLLCFILLAAVLTSVFACSGKDAETEVTETASESVETTVEDPYAARKAVSDDLPQEDYDGYAFTVYLRTAEAKNRDFFAESENGDVVNDAVYSRNRSVSERFNITVKFGFDDTNTTTYNTTAVKAILANEDTNDLLALHGAWAFYYAKEGYLLDWKTELEYVDLSREWWDQDFINSMAISGRLFAMTGDISHISLGSTLGLIFNKDLFDEYLLDYPYQTVSDGGWTFDAFDSVLKTASVDLNGDGVISPDSDQYGLATDSWGSPICSFYAANDRVISIDAEGTPSLTVYSERTVDVLSRFYSIIKANNVYITDVDSGYEGDIFRSGRAFMYSAGMNSLVTHRDMEQSIGILPNPKYDETISFYPSLVDAGQNVFSVPVTASDPSRSSVIIEAFAAEGYKSIVPTYFETALQVKYTRDDESSAMLNIIRDGRIFDYGYFDSTISSDLSYIGRNVALNGNYDMASYCSARLPKAEAALEQLYEHYLDLD